MDLTANLISIIMNPALISIAENPLTGVSDPSTQATRCKEIYESVRNAELRERFWNCAKDTAVLTKDGTDPILSDWTYRYAIPTTYACIIRLEYDYDYTIMSGYILTNYADASDQIGVYYIKKADVTSGTAIDAELAVWDDGLINVMVKRMAAELSLALKKKNSSKEAAWSLYDIALQAASVAEGFEDRHEVYHRTEEESSWVSCRSGD